MRKKCAMKVSKYWNQLTKKAVESPSMEIFGTGQGPEKPDAASSTLSGVLDWMGFRNPIQSHQFCYSYAFQKHCNVKEQYKTEERKGK